MNLIAKNLFVGTLYYVFGRLGLMLSADPVMATLFWPGAGVIMAALYLGGYRLLPGVYIGAAAVNFSAVYGSDPVLLSELPIVRILLMGVPPTLQALTGAYLVRRFLGPQTRLETLRDVGIFSVCAGPVSCLISPTLAVFILYAYGLISPVSIPLSWTTWYVGDMLGVLIFAPVCVMVFNKAISIRRKVHVAAPLVSIFFLVICAFFYAIKHENDVRIEQLRTDSDLIALTLQSALDESFAQLTSVRGLFYASDYVSASEFGLFLKHVFTENPSVRGVYWAPRIVREDVRAFEARASKELGQSYKILEMGAGGEGLDAADRSAYFPIFFAEQSAAVKPLIGYDFGAIPDVRRAIEGDMTGRDLRSFEAGSIFMPQEENHLVLFIPVFDMAKVDELNLVPKGFVIGLFNIEDILGEIRGAWAEKGINLAVLTGDRAAAFLPQMANDSSVFRKDRFGTKYLKTFSIADERWLLSFSLSPAYVEGRVNWGMWYVLAGSFLFTFLASGFLLIVTGHGAATEAIVSEKTLQLKDQTNFLKVVMDNVPDMLFVKNEQHEIVAANTAFLKLYPPEDRINVVGRTGLEVFTPEEQVFYKQQDNLAFSKGYTEVFESNTDYLGVSRTLFTRKIRFQDSEGRFLMLGLARDVSEILTAREHLESILMATADGLMVIEESGVISTFNKACEQIFGFEREEVIGKSVSLLEPESQAMEEQGNFLYYVTLPGKAGQSTKRHELWARHRNGTIFPIYLAASHVKVGATSFYCAIVRDISVEKKAQEDLRRSNQELEDFAYVASHDLKAPLRHLSLSANFLLRNYTDLLDDKGKELLGIVRKSSERMFEMIDSLLAYSSVGRQDVEMSRISLEEVVRDVIEGVRSQIERSGAEIDIGSLPNISGNKALMIQLFQNLMENAIKYRHKDVAPKIKVSAAREGKFWKVSVADNGIGIDPQYKEKIFNIFQRLHGESEYDGTGIGLAICQRIAEFHGGSISLDETYSGGSRFVIALPAV